MLTVRQFVAAAAVLAVTACAGAAPKEASTSAAMRDAIRIAEVSVDLGAVGATTKGRKMPASEAKPIIEAAAKQALVGKGTGKRAVRAVLTITSIDVIDAGRSLMIGGESVMKGTVALTDPRSGEVLMQPVKISSGGGGWVLGGIIAAASLEDPKTEVRQMAQEFAARAETVIFGK